MFDKHIKCLLFFVILLFGAPIDAYLHSINTENEFQLYSKDVDGSRFTKFVIDLTDDEIYFFNVNVQEMHAQFVASELLQCPFTAAFLQEFNKNYYLEEKPRYLLGYLVHHLNQELWTFAFWEGDRATAAQVTAIYKRLQQCFYLGDRLLFQPNSTYQEEVAKKLVDIPIVTNDELYRLRDFQPNNVGCAVGILRLISDQQLQVQPDEIVLLQELLPDISKVAGIITEQFATPLSHLSLRARAWGIPNIGLQGAFEKYRHLEGQYVYFEANRKGYELRLATLEEIANSQKVKEVRPIITLATDLSQKRLKSVVDLQRADIAAFGTKACFQGILARNAQGAFQVPSGFAIPMFYYAQHLRQSGQDACLLELMQDERFMKDRVFRKKALDDIREAICAFPINKKLLDAAWSRCLSANFYVRSSTNAEDLAGFTGAGLYDTVANVVDKPGLEAAIKRVWASLWNFKAFEERAHYGIDQQHVYAAVLVQCGLEASESGVLITKDIFDPHETMEVYTINAKWGLCESVVSGTTIPEQILYNLDNGGIKVLSRSRDPFVVVFDAAGGTKLVPNPYLNDPILTDARAQILASAARHIKRLFYEIETLDIEWLFCKEQLFIVQVRPF